MIENVAYHSWRGRCNSRICVEGLLEFILHRDIKASNVLLDVDFKAYIGDLVWTCLFDRSPQVRQDNFGNRCIWLDGPEVALHRESHQGIELHLERND